MVSEAPTVPVVAHELIATDVAIDKLGARAISVIDAERALWNRHVVIANRRGRPGPATRR